MQNKTVIVILTIAVGLLAYIFLFERGSMTTSERLERKGRVFLNFKKEAVERLELKVLEGTPLVLTRKDKGIGVEEGLWQIQSPKKLEAEGSAIREVLSAIDFVLAARAVEGKENVKNARFGLDAPRIEGTFTVRGKTVAFKLGAETEDEKVYLSTSEAPNTVYVVELDFFKSMNKSLDDLRSKTIVTADLADVASMSVKRPLGTVNLKKDDDSKWQVKIGETWILAASDQVSELTRTVTDLKAASFVKDGAKNEELKNYGLNEKALEVTLTPKEGKPISVRVGNPCKETKQRYVTVADSGVVACATDGLGAILERPILRFQETRPVVISPDDVTKISIKEGAKSLSMTKGEAGWTLEGQETPLDEAAIETLTKVLTETRATQIDVGDAATSSLPAPTSTATLTLADDMGTLTLNSYGASGETGRIRRGEEPAVLTVPLSLIAQLSADLLPFRSKQLQQGETDQITKLEISGPAKQTLEKQEGVWRITSPFESAGDNSQVRTLARLIADLNVESFVAEKAEPTHGFNAPFAKIAATFTPTENAKDEHNHDHDHDHDHDHGEKPSSSDKDKLEAPKTVVLEIGAKTEDGKRYGRLKGKDTAVFLLSADYEEAIDRPLLARDLLQVDDTKTVKLAFTAMVNTITLVKENDKWKSEGETVIKEESLSRIVQDLAGLKVINTRSFGPLQAATPNATLQIKSWTKEQVKDDKPDTLTIGAKSDIEKEDGYLASKDGVNATFVIPARIVDEILQLITPLQAEKTEKSE